jgi:hypothetical protein
MLRIKSGVQLAGVRPELWFGIQRALGVFDSYQLDMWITSVMDGDHRKWSSHYDGRAFDLRTRHLSKKLKERMTKAMLAALAGTEFHFYDESQTRDNQHWHISWHPSSTRLAATRAAASSARS